MTRRLLVTGQEDQLAAFQRTTSMLLSPVHKNGKSVLFASTEKGYDVAKAIAERENCAVQVWDGENWAVVVDGSIIWSP